MQDWQLDETFTPGLIDVEFLPGMAEEGYVMVGFDAGREGNKRYVLEVDPGLLDEERGVMVVQVLKHYADGNCLLLLPGESLFYNDRAILPKSKIYAWSPRGTAKQAV